MSGTAQGNPPANDPSQDPILNPQFELSSRASATKFPLVFVVSALSVAVAIHGICIIAWEMITGSLVADIVFCLLFATIFIGFVYLLWQNRLDSHEQRKYRGLLCCVVAFGSMSVVGICHTIPELCRRIVAEPAAAAAGSSKSPAETTAEPAEAHEPAAEPAESASEHGASSHSINILEVFVWFVLAPVSFYFLFKAEHHLPERFFKQEPAHPDGMGVKHLILPLTAPNIAPHMVDNQVVFSDGKIAPITLTGDIQKDIDALQAFSPKSNWQQLLRAIQPHCKSLQSVWIISSNGTRDTSPAQGALNSNDQNAGGSFGYAEIARTMISPYLAKDTRVYRCQNSVASNPAGLEFHDYFAVEQLILKVIAKIQETFPGTNESDIMIDTTGGQKSMSIVGAAVTFRRQTRFQYVNTGGNFTPFVYDVIFETPPQTAV